MIIIRVMGGLGNQMYQYALYRKLQSIGKNVKLDISIYTKNVQLDAVRPFQLDVFENLKLEFANEKEVRKVCRKAKNIYVEELLRRLFGNRNNIFYENENGYVNEEIYLFENKYLSGYWQNIAYFQSVADLIQKELIFVPSKKKSNKDWEEKILNSCSISVHVRRGDFLKNPQMYGGICTKRYYEKAFEIMNEKYKNITYYFFTDDIEYVEKNFQLENMMIVDENQEDEAHYDMCLMSKCKGNIIANSSYSWWAAFLNQNSDKTVIAPDKLVYSSVLTEQQRVEGWIYLDAE